MITHTLDLLLSSFLPLSAPVSAFFASCFGHHIGWLVGIPVQVSCLLSGKDRKISEGIFLGLPFFSCFLYLPGCFGLYF